MTLVTLQYPAVLISFALCAVFAVLTGQLRRGNLFFLVCAGIFGAATVLLALVFSVPVEEILLMLAGIALVTGCTAPREERK
jgi:hypothetical protein